MIFREELDSLYDLLKINKQKIPEMKVSVKIVKFISNDIQFQKIRYE